jgi:hypothetical protein
MARHGQNSGGVWDAATAQATYVRRPDKESPLWNVYSQGIYWWTATEIDPEHAYIILPPFWSAAIRFAAAALEQEQAYLRALNAAARYRIDRASVDGDRLQVYNEAGTQILEFVPSTSAELAGEGMPTVTTAEFSLDCTLEMDETYRVGEPVSLRFALHNPTDRPLYVLIWYTPLEGMAGDIFQVTRNGDKLPYQGMLAKRGDPTRDEYVVVEPGETASAQVDLKAGYGLSTPGSYLVQFTTGLQDVTGDGSLLPRKRENHRPQPVPCNTVGFSIVPAPEPLAAPTDVPPTATPMEEKR